MTATTTTGTATTTATGTAITITTGGSHAYDVEKRDRRDGARARVAGRRAGDVRLSFGLPGATVLRGSAHERLPPHGLQRSRVLGGGSERRLAGVRRRAFSRPLRDPASGRIPLARQDGVEPSHFVDQAARRISDVRI